MYIVVKEKIEIYEFDNIFPFSFIVKKSYIFEESQMYVVIFIYKCFSNEFQLQLFLRNKVI